MKHHGVNITTPPTTLPPLPGWNASPSVIAHQYVAIKHKIQDLCVCVCWRRGGGERKTKQFLAKENQVMEQNQTPLPPIPNPVSDVMTSPPQRFRKTCQTSNLTT